MPESRIAFVQSGEAARQVGEQDLVAAHPVVFLAHRLLT
jgi:hypothetical protein